MKPINAAIVSAVHIILAVASCATQPTLAGSLVIFGFATILSLPFTVSVLFYNH